MWDDWNWNGGVVFGPGGVSGGVNVYPDGYGGGYGQQPVGGGYRQQQSSLVPLVLVGLVAYLLLR